MGQASVDWESVRTECHALVARGRFELLLASARREILKIRAQVRSLRLARAVEAFGRDASERAYNPDQPRVPAGNPDGGQWTSLFGGSSGELDEVQDSTAGDWIEIAANGHHFVPAAVATAKDLHLSDEAIRAFDREKTGPLLGRRHGWSPEHAVYNSAVRERLDQFLAERGIRPQDMTAAQAREFAASIRSSTDPRIRDFNLQIYRRQLFYLFRRYRIRD